MVVCVRVCVCLYVCVHACVPVCACARLRDTHLPSHLWEGYQEYQAQGKFSALAVTVNALEVLLTTKTATTTNKHECMTVTENT